MDIETIIKIVNALSVVNAPKPANTERKRKIVVGERGWVWCGDVWYDGTCLVIENAKNIRVWGTTKGLGQLATEGKQSKTELDPCGTVRVPEIAVIALYDVKDGVCL